MNEQEEFFWRGKYFDSLQEMIEYSKNWPSMQLDLEQYRSFLDDRYREAQMNLKMRGTLTNAEAYKLLRMNTDWVDEKAAPTNEEELKNFNEWFESQNKKG